jgi:dCTP deaminase
VILTGLEIERRRRLGELHLEPFIADFVNPCSYNYRLAPLLRTLDVEVVDPRAGLPLVEMEIPPQGLVLEPRRVYLGTTVEEIGGSDTVPCLIGRSSLGRLGVFVQFAADMGNTGACHHWTLEIEVVQPVRLYPGMVIGQVSFWTTVGAVRPYQGRFGSIDEATTPPPPHLLPHARPSASSLSASYSL